MYHRHKDIPLTEWQLSEYVLLYYYTYVQLINHIQSTMTE